MRGPRALAAVHLRLLHSRIVRQHPLYGLSGRIVTCTQLLANNIMRVHLTLFAAPPTISYLLSGAQPAINVSLRDAFFVIGISGI